MDGVAIPPIAASATMQWSKSFHVLERAVPSPHTLRRRFQHARGLRPGRFPPPPARRLPRVLAPPVPVGADTDNSEHLLAGRPPHHLSCRCLPAPSWASSTRMALRPPPGGCPTGGRGSKQPGGTVRSTLTVAATTAGWLCPRMHTGIRHIHSPPTHHTASVHHTIAIACLRRAAPSCPAGVCFQRAPRGTSWWSPGAACTPPLNAPPKNSRTYITATPATSRQT